MEDRSNTFQMIDEDGKWNDFELQNFIKNTKFSECGLSYVVVSIVGPPTSGMSTLLNHMFQTNDKRLINTKGIWLAKCNNIEPYTIAFDVEGFGGRKHGTSFEWKSRKFAFEVSDIILINIRHQCEFGDPARLGISKDILKLMMSKRHKTSLIFVIRDSVNKTTPSHEALLWERLQMIWNCAQKPEKYKDAPFSQFFNVEIIALSSFEQKEQFKSEVAIMRERFFNSIVLDGVVRNRDFTVPASDFFLHTKKIWRDNTENYKCDLPFFKLNTYWEVNQLVVEKQVKSFEANEEWHLIKKAAYNGFVPEFGKKVNSILDNLMISFDMNNKSVDDITMASCRQKLKSNLLELVQPVYNSLLKQQISKTIEDFTLLFEKALEEEGFAAVAHDRWQSFIHKFDEDCKDFTIKLANWDIAEARGNVKFHIEGNVTSICKKQLSELLSLHEEKLKMKLLQPVRTILETGNENSWPLIRKTLQQQTMIAVREFSCAISSIDIDEEIKNISISKLQESSKGVVESTARGIARSALELMNVRFKNNFNFSSEFIRRVWTETEDISAITRAACLESLKLLSVLVAIRLDENIDNVQNTLVHSLLDVRNASNSNRSIQPSELMFSSSWADVPAASTLITPFQCMVLWSLFMVDVKDIVAEVQIHKDDLSPNNRHNNWWNINKRSADVP